MGDPKIQMHNTKAHHTAQLCGGGALRSPVAQEREEGVWFVGEVGMNLFRLHRGHI